MSAAERLVLFDLDGTLINDAYQITDDGIYPAIRQTQEAGWAVGLNSDTPYDALCIWRNRFGMNGPIVAEKGAVVELDGQPVFAAADAAEASAARRRIGAYATARGMVLWTGNPVEALRQGLRIGRPGKTALLLNDLSRCSLRFFVRVIGPDGELKLDDLRAQEVVADCQPLFPAFDAVDMDYNPTFGLLIASPGGVTKRGGVQQLLESMDAVRRVMVGNSMTDYLGDDMAEHFAVGNASPEYQAVATTAEAQWTSGCVEILRRLMSNYVINGTGEQKR
jgi:hypothetical protein